MAQADREEILNGGTGHSFSPVLGNERPEIIQQYFKLESTPGSRLSQGEIVYYTGNYVPTSHSDWFGFCPQVRSLSDAGSELVDLEGLKIAGVYMGSTIASTDLSGDELSLITVQGPAFGKTLDSYYGRERDMPVNIDAVYSSDRGEWNNPAFKLNTATVVGWVYDPSQKHGINSPAYGTFVVRLGGWLKLGPTSVTEAAPSGGGTP